MSRYCLSLKRIFADNLLYGAKNTHCGYHGLMEHRPSLEEVLRAVALLLLILSNIAVGALLGVDALG